MSLPTIVATTVIALCVLLAVAYDRPAMVPAVDGCGNRCEVLVDDAPDMAAIETRGQLRQSSPPALALTQPVRSPLARAGILTSRPAGLKG